MSTAILEAVSFRLNHDVSEEDFLTAFGATVAFISERPGFRNRRLSVDETGEWLDVVEWDDMESAQAAGALFTTTPTLVPFIAAIDPASLVMRHNRLVA